MTIFVLLCMCFMAIVDDFYLQPIILSKLKQIDWWKENAPQKKYKNDYLMALFIHSFSWSFMTNIPAILYAMKVGKANDFFMAVACLSILLQMTIHVCIDNSKANEKNINLCTDQFCHFAQILFQFVGLVLLS